MQILSKITNKTIDTGKYFNPDDYTTENNKSVSVFLAPRNIGKTTAYLNKVIEIINNGGQFIWLRNTPTEADTTWNEISEKFGAGIEKRGHEGAIYFLNNENGRFDKNKSICIGAVCGFEQLRFWRSSNILKNLEYIFWDEVITEQSAARPIPNIFNQFIEHLKTIEREKKKLKFILFSNKPRMTCDLFWKMGARFENKNEFQEKQIKIGGVEINMFWLPHFEIKEQIENISMADALATLDSGTNNYLNNGVALIDNTADLIDSNEIKTYTLLYGIEKFKDYFYIGKNKDGDFCVIMENFTRLSPIIYSFNAFTDYIPVSSQKIQQYANLFAKLKIGKKIKFDSEYTRNFIEDIVNSYSDCFEN